MVISRDTLHTALESANPWWGGQPVLGVPPWHRSIFDEFYAWLTRPPTHMAVAVFGMRRVGKTSLLFQTIGELVEKAAVPPGNILYVNLELLPFAEAGIDQVLEAWRELVPREGDGPEYIFLDEVQSLDGWGIWVKHQVDTRRDRRIAFTGSALPLAKAGHESGVGRWHNLRMPPLSFSEHLHLAGIEPPQVGSMLDLRRLFDLKSRDFMARAGAIKGYLVHFHRYLGQGGFPQTANVRTLEAARRLLHDDILLPALKGDIPSIFGIRNPQELQRVFHYLCMHEGGVLSMESLQKSMQVSKRTAQNYIEILQEGHLVYRLAPFGYGKEVLRGRIKVYTAGAGMAPAMTFSRLEGAEELGAAAEAAVFRHLSAHCQNLGGRISYWRKDDRSEVDFVVEREGQAKEEESAASSGESAQSQESLRLEIMPGEYMPIEVKYRRREMGQRYTKKELAGLLAFCAQKQVRRAYVVTRHPWDFGPQTLPLPGGGELEIMRVPAVLLCYWLGQAESSWRMASV